MTKHGNPVGILTPEECWELAATQRIGRIVTRVRDIMDIVPINFIVDGETVVFRTAAGSKLAELAINPSVLFEIDEIGERTGWSIVVRGEARIISKESEILAVEELGLRTNIATAKPTFVRIEPDSVSGRAFTFKTEPGEE